jgi:ABC-type sugar transport system ATPase subunit
MRGQIKEVLAGLSKATVIVTHDQLEALTMADRIAIMREGLIEQVGTPHQVFTKPANVFVASFIGTPQMNLVPAALTSAGGGKCEFTLGGDTIEMELNPLVASLQAPNVTVGIRPRAFSPQSAPGKDSITVCAELIEPMGAETLIHARINNDLEIRAVVPREARVKMGDVLHLRPDPAQTHVFGEDGKAVRP